MSIIVGLPSHRELAVRFLSEAIQHVSSYAEFELLLEIAFALANDHGREYERLWLQHLSLSVVSIYI